MAKEPQSNKETKKPVPVNLRLIYPLVVILGVISVLTLFITFSFNNVTEAKLTELNELNRPADIQIIKIEDSACNNCVDVSVVMDSIVQNNVNVTSKETLNFDSVEAKELIERYNIQQVPAILVFGEIEKSGDMGLFKLGDVLMLDAIPPPYTDALSGEIVGLVDLISLVDGSCTDCYDEAVHKRILTDGFGILINNEKTVDISDDEGKALIEKYNIELVPTVIVSSEVSVYPASEELKQFFTVSGDGSYVFTDFEAMGDINYTNLTQLG